MAFQTKFTSQQIHAKSMLLTVRQEEQLTKMSKSACVLVGVFT